MMGENYRPVSFLLSFPYVYMRPWSLTRRACRMSRRAAPPIHHVDPCRFYPSEPVGKWCDPSTSAPPTGPFWIHGNLRFGTTPLMTHLRIAAASFLDREIERVASHARSVFSVIGRMPQEIYSGTGRPACINLKLCSRLGRTGASKPVDRPS
jgi:hypothetical protein